MPLKDSELFFFSAQEKYSAVVMDFIATRDINPDEEIFIDYGKSELDQSMSDDVGCARILH